MDLPVDGDRLRADIEATAEFGAIDSRDRAGRTVLTGTDANREAREYFVERSGDAGLEIRIDAVGNVVGRWTPESADPEAAPVASGSHLDSVIEGGIFDGPLGVYAALEAVRAIEEATVAPERPIEVVCFTEEEGGRFGEGLLGSSVATGTESVEETLAAEDDEGTTLEAALCDIGYRGTDRLDAGAWNAWLELHIEQGTRLESREVPVGVVSTVTGITHCRVTIEGEADHAGTTPMGTRTDALAAASELVLAVEAAARRAAGAGPDGSNAETGTAVGTVGKSLTSPNATNVVPGRVDLGIDVRDIEREPIEMICETIEETLSRLETERGVETTFVRPFDVSPTPMTERCRDALTRAASTSEIDATTLHSGAAHDTMHVARVTDAGMLFAPSRGGYSHSPREWTDWADCARATEVLAAALADLAGA